MTKEEICNYRIARTEQEVNEFLAEGWELWGSPFGCESKTTEYGVISQWGQAMVCGEPDDAAEGAMTSRLAYPTSCASLIARITYDEGGEAAGHSEARKEGEL
jgi:hypothetical protein